MKMMFDIVFGQMNKSNYRRITSTIHAHAAPSNSTRALSATPARCCCSGAAQLSPMSWVSLTVHATTPAGTCSQHHQEGSWRITSARQNTRHSTSTDCDLEQPLDHVALPRQRAVGAQI
jgi:hypothetical protein